MTPEELDEARAKEALRRLVNSGQVYCHEDIAALGARLAREGWTPPEPVVDQDVLAWREWVRQTYPNCADMFNNWELDGLAEHFIAGARMAREQERERAKVLVECVERYAGPHAAVAIAKYRGEW